MARVQASELSTSGRLLEVLSDYRNVLVVMHDNPDPDAIAAGWGLEVLVRESLDKPISVVGGGAIVRAENRHMVQLLQPPIELVDDITVEDETATVLVDCGAEATNHLLTRHGIEAVAIIDHHTNGQRDTHARYMDIRPDVAASATIAASYLREQHLAPGAKLATAMLYAVRTETCGHETHYSALDREILPWLTECAEPALLAEIENAPLTRDYFGDLYAALQNTILYDDVALCFLPRAAGAEIVGEVADLLVRCDGMERVLCAAVVGEDLLLSARTQRGCGSAVRLLLTTVEGMGGGGGHAHRAGGKVPGVARDATVTDGLLDELRRRWLAACGIAPANGFRLVPDPAVVRRLS